MDGSVTSVAGPSLFSPGGTVRYITATSTFASTHRADDSPHLHGHAFSISVTELGSDSGVRLDLPADLEEVTSELHLHDLEEMLYGGRQELDYIAAWIMERLLLRHPRIVEAEIWTLDRPSVRVGIRREIR